MSGQRSLLSSDVTPSGDSPLSGRAPDPTCYGNAVRSLKKARLSAAAHGQVSSRRKMSIPHKVDTRHARLGLAKGAPIGQQRRQYSPEFKADAVALVRSSGRSISAIAREFGIGESNLGYWLKKDEADRKTATRNALRPSPPNLPKTGRCDAGWQNWRWSARS